MNRNCTGPVTNYVEFIPFLRYFPGMAMLNRGKALHEGLCDTVNTFIEDLKRRIEAGEDVPDCLAKNLLSVQKEEGLDDLDVTFLCCAFLIGGVESVSHTSFPCYHYSRFSHHHGFLTRALQCCSGSSRSYPHTLRFRHAHTKSSTVSSAAIACLSLATQRICPISAR